ncbi:MAG: GntR family transcriptional regulator [Aliishimia sp.]
MKEIISTQDSRTSADIVFDSLYQSIISLGLLPGTKMSEAKVAEQFGVSRQPVRDAFNRLGNLKLLRIQPQRATRVRKFSVADIETARFIRLSLELEISRTATELWDDSFAPRFDDLLAQQDCAVENGDTETFHMLDERFHALITEVAQKPFALEMVKESKAQVQRICVLSLNNPDEMYNLAADHRRIYAALSSGDKPTLETELKLHLSRLEKTVESVRMSHADYFVE